MCYDFSFTKWLEWGSSCGRVYVKYYIKFYKIVLNTLI